LAWSGLKKRDPKQKRGTPNNSEEDKGQAHDCGKKRRHQSRKGGLYLRNERETDRSPKKDGEKRFLNALGTTGKRDGSFSGYRIDLE